MPHSSRKKKNKAVVVAGADASRGGVADVVGASGSNSLTDHASSSSVSSAVAVAANSSASSSAQDSKQKKKKKKSAKQTSNPSPSASTTSSSAPQSSLPAVSGDKKSWTIGQATVASPMLKGRAAWYSSADGGHKKPFIIGVTGGTASGKTTVCEKIVERLNLPWVLLLSTDRYYKSLTEEQYKSLASYNFDHPDAFDWDELVRTLEALSASRSVEVPVYSFKLHKRLDMTDTLYGADVVIVEGILSLYDKRVRDFFDMKIFVDADADLRLARRLRRDIVERGRTVDGVLRQYELTVKPSFDDFIAPTKRYADLVIPRGGDNNVAIDLLVEHIRLLLSKRGVRSSSASTVAHAAIPTPLSPALVTPIADEKGHAHFTPSSNGVHVSAAAAGSVGSNDAKSVHSNAKPKVKTGGRRAKTEFKNVFVLSNSQAVKLIHTKLRDRLTATTEFQEYTNRLSRLVLAQALGYVCDSDRTVTTPTQALFVGKALSPNFCGVSVVRGGDVIERVLTDMCPTVTIGKIVIQQTPDKNDGPRLYFCKLPAGISTKRVMLMDAVVSTANSVHMAVRVLLDHNVSEENIIFVCLLSSPQGISSLATAYPKMRIVCSMVDEGLDELQFVTPGLGSFGNRYFGTSPASNVYESHAEAEHAAIAAAAVTAAACGNGGHGAAVEDQETIEHRPVTSISDALKTVQGVGAERTASVEHSGCV